MLSVSGKTQSVKKSRALFLVGKGVTLAALLLATLRGEGSQISGYDYYRSAGSPQLNKVVWDERSKQYGIWTVPNGANSVEESDEVATPRRRAAPRTERPAARTRATKPKPSAERTEAGCDGCAIAGATSTRETTPLGRAGRDILKVAGAAAAPKKVTPKKSAKKALKRTPEVEAEEEREYDEMDEDKEPAVEKSSSKAPGKFVQNLLKNATSEANRSCRSTSNGTKCKRSIGKGLGMCLQGVRMALQRTKGMSTAGGIGVLNAKDAGPRLRQFGYTRAAKGRYTPATAPLGAILIYDAPREPRKAGHIEIKGKNGYYSDYFNSRPISQLMPGRRRLIGIYLPPQN